MTETPVIPIHMRRDGYDPAAELGTLRRENPIASFVTPFGMTAWLLTRHADVRAVLGDAAHFSNRIPDSPMMRAAREIQGDDGPADRLEPGMLLAYDPPDHTRLRRMLTPEFTVARIRRLQPRIEAIVEEHLDRMAEAGSPADLVPSFALPIPSLVICELLGVPYEDRAEFQALSRTRLNMALPLEERLTAISSAREYMAGLVKRLREDPDENMIGMLIRDHGADLTDEELVGIGDLLLIAGHETTSNMLGIGTLALLRHPDQLAAVRDDPEAIGPAIEELMRYLSVVHSGMPRRVVSDVTVGGKDFKAGDIAFLSLPAANRDEAFGDNLDSLDIRREITSHVAFGHGIHHCLGAPLARMEMRIAFPALLRRFPTLKAEISYEDVAFRSFSVVFGVESLPVSW